MVSPDGASEQPPTQRASNDDDDAGGGDGDDADLRLCGCRVKLNVKVNRCKSDTSDVLANTQ